ncbi:MAG: hypothetical protein KatS3mg002_1426 [Candidatus Woesearchaeota archaeon]|nr:MAG: hypothetical protein KatS3mg002_1426 [Candidatus Woesearchaeota archaeon]
MRIQEHLFQGFFGIKKKKDSAKYYSERIDKLKGISSELDNCISEFQKILNSHKKKISLYNKFLDNPDDYNYQKIKNEIKKLENMFDEGEISQETEKKHAYKIEKILTELINNEENIDIATLQRETLSDIKELMKLLENIKPLWEQQIDTISMDGENIINKEKIKKLTEIFKEESKILIIEEDLLKKIELKTSNILRKTNLKFRDIEKTKDMNIRYREIRHIR